MAAALHHLTLHEARGGMLDRREISAVELTEDVLGRIDAVEASGRGVRDGDGGPGPGAGGAPRTRLCRGARAAR